ncbi:uncharacterized protein YjbI with pentapeptide repeats, partial [Thermostichus sp. MS-CIW-30]
MPTVTDKDLGNIDCSLEILQPVLRGKDPRSANGAIKCFSHYNGKGRELLLQTLNQPLDWEKQFALWTTLMDSGDPQLIQIAKAYPVTLRPVGDLGAKLEAGERDFRWADLRKANLSQRDLSGADLRGANLNRARLSQVNLSHANLSGANLTQADLSGADLNGANLSGANLLGTNLIGASLLGANLTDANLRWVVISPKTQMDPKWHLVWTIINGVAQGESLAQADLSGANLERADLRGRDLTRANLRGARLAAANLRGANLSQANLSEANLEGADLTQ